MTRLYRNAMIPLSLVALTAAFPTAAFAWGANGHRIVGEIAQNHLTPEAAGAVQALLGPESLARAATWPDEIRSDPSWDHAKPWHFISIDDEETLETTERSPDGDVLEAMGRFEGVLRDPEASRQEKVQALRFLVHFVGDVHQPLHVGRRGDRGGNSIRVEWFWEGSNLHSVWDQGLIESQKLSFTEYVAFIDHPTLEQVREWQDSTYEDWVNESFGHRAQVYDFGGEVGEETPRLNYQYAFVNVPLVEERLLLAGVRLAGVLNDVFTPAE